MMNKDIMHYSTLKNGHLGAVIDHTLVDLPAAAIALSHSFTMQTMHDLITMGEAGQQQIQQLAHQAISQNVACVAYDDHLLQSPLGSLRRNVFCIGKNYVDHAVEVAAKLDNEVVLPEHPIVFTKATNTLLGPQQSIPQHANVTQKIDYEAELALVIGNRGFNIKAQDAWQYIFGYTCYNDVSARDLQRRHVQWHIGKSLDGFGPMGPVITPTHGKPIDDKTTITSQVNDEIRQQATLSQLIFSIPTLIECLSKGMTLEPGDVIATGTPAGVGMGFTPAKFLQAGDTVTVAISGTLPLVNRLEH